MREFKKIEKSVDGLHNIAREISIMENSLKMLKEDMMNVLSYFENEFYECIKQEIGENDG